MKLKAFLRHFPLWRLASLIVLCLPCLAALGQQQVATLSHDGQVSVYYGLQALVEAYEAAEDGDVINLSTGYFTAPSSLAKSITISGAGMDGDIAGNVLPTILTGDFNVDDNEKHPKLEYIYHNHLISIQQNCNLTLTKCRLNNVQGNGFQLGIVNIINCRISGTLDPNYCYGGNALGNLYCQNSIINKLSFNLNHPTASFSNCIIGELTNRNPGVYCNFYSCVFKDPTLIPEGQCMNCVNIGTKDIFTNSTNDTNKIVEEASTLFKTSDGSYSESDTYELTETAKTEYIGTDGNEVGIYGGVMPFDPQPIGTRITNFEVAKKSTAEGKLPITITLSTN